MQGHSQSATPYGADTSPGHDHPGQAGMARALLSMDQGRVKHRGLLALLTRLDGLALPGSL